jgi:hypothetical protein
MAENRPTLTPEHRDLLRHFVRLVDDMSRSRFIERYRTQDHKISCGPNGTIAPEYDWEDFRSFLTIFRQVAVSQGDPVYLSKITGMVGRYASDDLRRKIAEMRSLVLPRLEGKYHGMKLGRDALEGKQAVSLTTHEILDALVNGYIFHPDKKHRQTIEFLDSVKRWQYLWPLLVEVIMPTVRACVWLFKAIHYDGILERSDYPARCFSPC